MFKKLKILIFSPSFLPKIGGLENTISAIANAYCENRHEVIVITSTPLAKDLELDVPYSIYRRPNLWQTFKLFYWCNLVHYPNISLKGIWPLLFLRRTFCISHHTTNYKLDGSLNFLGKLKYYVATCAHNASCSHYTNSLLYKKGVVIHSPYNEKQFYIIADIKREKDLVFLGRLVSDKGCNLIIEAIKILKNEKQIKPTLTIIGDGPELNNLKNLVKSYELEDQVIFQGSVTGNSLNLELNKHKILIVPSVWEEPFGKVAVEGLAAGCKVIVSKSGGLPEAIGELGTVFEKENYVDLANKIELILISNLPNEQLILNHLKEFTIASAGRKYTNWIEQSYL